MGALSRERLRGQRLASRVAIVTSLAVAVLSLRGAGARRVLSAAPASGYQAGYNDYAGVYDDAPLGDDALEYDGIPLDKDALDYDASYDDSYGGGYDVYQDDGADYDEDSARPNEAGYEYDDGYQYDDEYQYDNRSMAEPITFADNDIFLATRLTLNDAQDTALLAGVTMDTKTSETYLNIEGERRFGSNIVISLRARFITGLPRSI